MKVKSDLTRVRRLPERGRYAREVCLTATLLDGWVLARSAFNHSANYRAAMCFGEPRVIEDDERKIQLLESFTEQRYPGRWAQLRPMTRQELRATTVLTMPLDMASVKVRTGPPHDPEKDWSWPVWAGVIPVRQVAARAAIAEGVPGGVKPPRLSVAQRGRR
jgi:nitroimidazol reductase NimA-like FMN-containing flavoprotein (pyridoxamine 5'-phosphate oxidase superfamily)